MHYFDYAAATPVSAVVRKAMEPFLSDTFYNPSASYLAARDVKHALESARKDVAAVIGAKSSEIIFTAGGTEADNLAISGVMSRYPGVNVIASAIEHEAILETVKLHDYKIVPVNSDGRVNLAELSTLINDKTVLVSIMYANNEIGTIQPLHEVSKLIRDINSKRLKAGNKLPLYFHTDASQAPNYLRVLVNTLGVDLLSLNAGKIYGPKETGALYIKSGVILVPLIRGGGQERGLRSGTQNVANIAGFVAALKDADKSRESESIRMAKLQSEGLHFLNSKLPSATINGSLSSRLPNNIHLTIPGSDNERLLMELDEKGFMVAAGSACSASSDEPSHVLKAIGLSDADARSSLRITMGRDTTKDSLEHLINAIAQLVKAP